VSFRGAVTELSKIAVAGVTNSYDLDDMPDSLKKPKLPALLPFLGGQSQEAEWTVGAFEGGGPMVTYQLQHVLFVAPVGKGLGLRSVAPEIATLIDAYATALSTGRNMFLDDEISYALDYRILAPGTAAYPAEGDTHYYAVTFEHRWRINL
jgi:hypothetical protein